mgnify:CR=1 FL=1
MRLCQFLMQDESFPISHAGWDFLVFSLKMRFSHILIQDETFPISHAGWDFRFSYATWDFLSEVWKTNKKKNTLLRPLHYVLAVKKIGLDIKVCYWTKLIVIPDTIMKNWHFSQVLGGIVFSVLFRIHKGWKKVVHYECSLVGRSWLHP